MPNQEPQPKIDDETNREEDVKSIIQANIDEDNLKAEDLYEDQEAELKDIESIIQTYIHDNGLTVKDLEDNPGWIDSAKKNYDSLKKGARDDR